MEALVSPQWLADNQAIRDIVILDATLKKTMNTANVTTGEVIPGSVFFDLENTFSNPDSPLPHTFPVLSSMSSLLASDIKKMKDLEDENRRLKQMFADLSLECRALKDVIEKKL